MTTPSGRPHRPSWPLWLGVAAAHVALLTAPPHRQAPAPSARHVPVLLTRTVAATDASLAMPTVPQPAGAVTPPTQTRSTAARTPRSSRAAPARSAHVAPARTTADSPSRRAPVTDPFAPAAAEPSALADVVTAAAPRAPDAPPPGDHPARDTAAAAPSAPARVPAAATLDYSVRGRVRGVDYSGQAQLRWQPDGTRYEALWTVDTPVLGTRSQRSEGAITPAGLAPLRFAERARSERAAHFDADGGRIRFSANTPDAAWVAGAQDRLSVTLQLAALLAAAPERYPPGTQITLPTAGVREAETWVWEVQGDELLHVGEQPLPCVKLLREPRRDYDSRIEVWLARGLAHLPVRLKITHVGGDVADQQLSALPLAPISR